MDRTIRYSITAEENGWRIKRFLRSRGYSVANLNMLKNNPRGILLNDVSAYTIAPVHTGDLLEINIHEEEVSEKIPPVDLPLDILYEDEDLMVLNKPSGMPIHPSMNHYENTLANALAYYFMQQGKSFVFRCINRLDRDTTGLTIIAKHSVSAAILSAQAVSHSLHREYLAIASGVFSQPEGTIDLPLGRAQNSAILRCVDETNGETAITHYRVLAASADASLLSIHLETGRTHQIRVHMLSQGHPLLGDFLYHPEDTSMARQALHSRQLSFRHPISGKTLTFTQPLPQDMRLCLQEKGICTSIVDTL